MVIAKPKPSPALPYHGMSQQEKPSHVETSKFQSSQVRSSQAKPNQVKVSQVKSSHIKVNNSHVSNKVKSNQVIPSLTQTLGCAQYLREIFDVQLYPFLQAQVRNHQHPPSSIVINLVLSRYLPPPQWLIGLSC